jgi:hypothetical protein
MFSCWACCCESVLAPVSLLSAPVSVPCFIIRGLWRLSGYLLSLSGTLLHFCLGIEHNLSFVLSFKLVEETSESLYLDFLPSKTFEEKVLVEHLDYRKMMKQNYGFIP